MKTIGELLDLRGKNAIITGAANGIGKAISKRLAEAGCNLILIDIDKQKLDIVAGDIRKEGYSVETHFLELSEKDQIDQFWETIDGKTVDILVNNAGIYPFKDFMKLDYAYLEKVMQVNQLHYINYKQDF